MSFVAKLVQSGSVPIHFVTFKDKNDRDVHFYIKTTPQKMEAFRRVQSGMFNLADYGEILVGGFGLEPTEASKSFMKEKYGLDV